VFYESVKMRNSLPVRIKQCDGLRTFKRELRGYISNIIQYIYNYNDYNDLIINYDDFSNRLYILLYLIVIFYSVFYNINNKITK